MCTHARTNERLLRTHDTQDTHAHTQDAHTRMYARRACTQGTHARTAGTAVVWICLPGTVIFAVEHDPFDIDLSSGRVPDMTTAWCREVMAYVVTAYKVIGPSA